MKHNRIISAIVMAVLLLSSLILWGGALPAAHIPWKKMADEKNAPLLIQQLTAHIKAQMEKDSEAMPKLIGEIEQYTEELKDSTVAALFHSLTAELYATYLVQHRNEIVQRKELVDYAPEDIREWTTNLFNEKIVKELNASLQPAEALQQISAEAYTPVLNLTEDSRLLRPTLYDFLMQRAIQFLPQSESPAPYYEAWIDFRRKENNPKALLLLQLMDIDRYDKSGEIYQTKLDSLAAFYPDKDCRLEIALKQLEVLQSKQCRVNSDAWNEKQQTIYNFCQEQMKKYGKNKRAVIFSNLVGEMDQPSLSVQHNNNVYPSQELVLQVSYRNVERMRVRIYQNLTNPERAMAYQEKVKKGKLVKEQEYDLPKGDKKKSFSSQDTTIRIRMDQPGLYLYQIEALQKEIMLSAPFSVSRLATVVRQSVDGATEVLVTDFQSGAPVPNAWVIGYQTTRLTPTEMQRVMTDAMGWAKIERGKGRVISAVRPLIVGDTSSLITHCNTGFYSPQQKRSVTHAAFFTDRAIYRPGQTVAFKAILYTDDGKQLLADAGESYTVSLQDANSIEVDKKTFTTNTFGSIHGEFVLPATTTNGSFRLISPKGSVSFRVEEYKRPSFRIDMEPIDEQAVFGQALTLKGKAASYSGVGLSSGKVRWRISTRPFWLRSYWASPFDYGLENIASGTVEVQDNGSFEIPFTPTRPATDRKSVMQLYEINLTVTDAKGETQETSSFFSAGDAAIVLVTNIPSQLEKEKADVEVSAQTLNGKPVNVVGSYTIYGLKPVENDRRTKKENYERTAPVQTGSFSTGQSLEKEIWASLPSARYRLVLTAKDERGATVETEQDFILYSLTDSCPPETCDAWMPNRRYEIFPGDTAQVVFGSSRRAIYLFYELFAPEGKQLHRELVRLDNSNRTFPICMEESYGDGVTASFTYIQDGKLVSEHCDIVKKERDHRLHFIPETFRDRLLPGSKEQWRFRLVDADSVAVQAEVLASMYDASLDAIISHSWFFAPHRRIQLWSRNFLSGYAFNQGYRSGTKDAPYKETYDYRYAEMFDKWREALAIYQIFTFKGPYSRFGLRNSKMVMEAELADDDMVMMADNAAPMAMRMANDELAAANGVEEVAEEKSSSSPDDMMQSIAIRENLAESAFFYPVLQTDEAGAFSFGFTLPESNTTWKLQLLAHTDSMAYGYYSQQVISSKPVMVQPHLPRFLREGDDVTLSAQILNQTMEPLSGKVVLELFVPEDNRIVYRSERSFSYTAKASGVVDWLLPVGDWSCHGVLGCRIVAATSLGNDGEQQLLPVLSKEVMVTESVPFYLMEEHQHTVTLPRQALEHPYRVTFELTANPVWYAVQALSSLEAGNNEDLLSWFAVYYSQTLARHIVRSHPKIKRVVDAWRAQGETASSLLSNLEKNEELKSVLLEETPWVLEAKSETEQQQRLQLLFDLNRTGSLRQEALDLLQKRQTEEGGWSWLPGMQCSRFMTLQILKGMAQLTELQAVEYSSSEKTMQIKALNYLDRELQRSYEWEMKQKIVDGVPSEEKIEQLFVRSFYQDIPMAGSSHEAYRYYTSQALKNWEKYGLYTRAALGWLMQKNGNLKAATTLYEWFQKTVTVDREKGCYWANNRTSFVGSHSAIETHCMLMAWASQRGVETIQMDRMKQWLLGQKRTQNWESVPASLDAIYALLLTGDSWVDASNSCQLSWNGHTWQSEKGEIATGYLKVSPSVDELKQSKDQSVEVSKQGNAPAWGAVYTQYFAPIASVEKQQGVLNVEKKLFIESTVDGKAQLQQVSENRTLKVGDKLIVRLTLRTDRAMNYVFIKDLRAACMEPAGQLSGSEYRDGIYFYRSSRDISENIYIENLPEGTFVLEYPAYITRSGQYASGICTVQCLYAPEFVSHTEGTVLKISSDE